MKKIIYVMLSVIFIITACSKENVEPNHHDDIEQENLKKSNTKPMKVWFHSIPSSQSEGYVGGEATHVGKVMTEESPFEKIPLGFKFPFATELISGLITAANGDSFYYSSIIVVNIIDATLTGTTTITGGTGKFENATGTVDIEGTVNFDDGTANWTGEGTITFP